MISNQERYLSTLSAIDQINEQDPNLEDKDGSKIPKELLYGQRMTEMLNKYDPDANEALQIAARGQHIKRWEIAREEYPMDRKGYLKWRTELKFLHARLLGEIMNTNKYDGETIDKVKTLVTKKKLKSDPDSQALEDVICLVFLEYYYQDFIKKHNQEKIISILQKTWGKMTEKGREMALKLSFNEEGSALISQALSPS